MRIISKYKDYYDFISGIYGEDPLVVLDRREYIKKSFSCLGDYEITLFVGGYKIEGYLKNGIFYYGENLTQVGELRNYKFFNYSKESFNVKDHDCCYHVGKWNNPINGTIIKDIHNYNQKENCPVLFADVRGNGYVFSKYPILSDFNLQSFIKAEEAYKMIYDWLSLQKTLSENKEDLRTNIQKIEGKGFDKKTSFRPNIK